MKSSLKSRLSYGGSSSLKHDISNFSLTCNSNSSLEYLPYSTIPPKTRMRVPSTTNPYAAHPGGMSPLTGGTNHWFVAEIEKFYVKLISRKI